jgi:hypothetical protein
MLLRPDVIAVFLASVLLLPQRGVGMHIKCECSLPVFGRFCLICRGSARARATSGEAEFCLRWETLGRSLGLRGTSIVSPQGFRPYFCECALQGNNSGIPNYHHQQC